jgi:hypothetical protein
MKCVIDNSTKKVDRVADETAHELVRAGTHGYTSKDAWREQNNVKAKKKKGKADS